jgi:hypothetical protein
MRPGVSAPVAVGVPGTEAAAALADAMLTRLPVLES